MKNGWIAAMAVAATLPFSLSAAHAQAWPTKTVRFIIPGTAGSAPDRTTRVFAEKLSQKWGVPVVVENRTGATATIGTAYVAKQPADGYTLLSTFTAFVQAPLLMADAQYDPVKDFIPVTQTMTAETVLSIRADSPYRTFADFAAAAKRDKPRLTYGSSGNGSSFNIYGETMKRGAGIPLTHVPYKGETLSLTDLLGGQITVNMNSIATALPHIQAGKLRPLAVVSPARSPALPDVPTFTELGIPNLDGGSWFGVFAPAGTPQAVVEKISADLNGVLADPALQKWLREQSLEPTGMTPTQFTAFIRKDLDTWRKMIADAGIKLGD